MLKRSGLLILMLVSVGAIFNIAHAQSDPYGSPPPAPPSQTPSDPYGAPPPPPPPSQTPSDPYGSPPLPPPPVVLGPSKRNPAAEIILKKGDVPIPVPTNYPATQTPVLSGDGRYIIFPSNNQIIGASGSQPAVFLDRNAGGSQKDIWLYDRTTKVVLRLYQGIGGSGGDAASRSPSISDDGERAVFTSMAGNLVEGDRNYADDVFGYDRHAPFFALRLLSIRPTGAQGSGREGIISGNGRITAYSSSDNDIVPNDTNRPNPVSSANINSDIFVVNWENGQLERITPPFQYSKNTPLSMSYDGNKLVFISEEVLSGFVDYVNHPARIYLATRTDSAQPFGSPVLVSKGLENVTSKGAVISRDGKWVALEVADKAVASISNSDSCAGTFGCPQIYLYDVTRDSIERISMANRSPGNGPSMNPQISDDGRYIFFASRAPNIVGESGVTAIMVKDNGGLHKLSAVDEYSGALTTKPSITGTGNYVAFNDRDASGSYFYGLANSFYTPPPPPCVYTYSDWGACQVGNTRTRTVAVASPQGCSGTPSLSQACTYVQPPPPVISSPPATSTPPKPSASKASCTDSDGGDQPKVFGRVKVINQQGALVTTDDDACVNSRSLKEKVCAGSVEGTPKVYPCLQCLSGVCK